METPTLDTTKKQRRSGTGDGDAACTGDNTVVVIQTSFFFTRENVRMCTQYTKYVLLARLVFYVWGYRPKEKEKRY